MTRPRSLHATVGRIALLVFATGCAADSPLDLSAENRPAEDVLQAEPAPPHSLPLDGWESPFGAEFSAPDAIPFRGSPLGTLFGEIEVSFPIGESNRVTGLLSSMGIQLGRPAIFLVPNNIEGYCWEPYKRIEGFMPKVDDTQPRDLAAHVLADIVAEEHEERILHCKFRDGHEIAWHSILKAIPGVQADLNQSLKLASVHAVAPMQWFVRSPSGEATLNTPDA